MARPVRQQICRRRGRIEREKEEKVDREDINIEGEEGEQKRKGKRQERGRVRGVKVDLNYEAAAEETKK
jgi:hypothetical protein